MVTVSMWQHGWNRWLSPVGYVSREVPTIRLKINLRLDVNILASRLSKTYPPPFGCTASLVMRPVRGVQLEHKVRKSSNRLILAVVIGLLILSVGSFFAWTIYQRQAIESIEPASVDQMAYPLPEKPSIAVLSFSNISDDPEIDYFINGFSDTLITALSKMPGIFVIARSSTSVYKGKSITINKISEELGIQYVIDGSIQKSGERLRVTVKMIDALTGYHVWSDQYSRNLKDIFAIQDDIVLSIVKSVGSKYNEIIESVTVEAAGTKNLDAYLKNLMSSISL